MQKFQNWFQTTLSQNLAAGSTTATVVSATGLSLGAGEHYRAVLYDGAGQKEVVLITQISGLNLTLQRGQEGSSALNFVIGDGLELRLTAGTLDSFFQRVELLDEDDFASNSASLPASQQSTKAYIQDHAFQPAGMIAAWLGGYFQTNANGSFTDVLGNTVAAANAYLNPLGWYVCDGAALNLAASPIWNAAGRYLPKLTDERFLQGFTVAGGTGGTNTMTSHTHTIPSHVHSLSAGYGYLSGEYGDWLKMRLKDVPGWPPTNYSTNYYQALPVGACSKGLELGGTTDGSGLLTSNANSAGLENRPKYLSCFYIIKVI